MNVSLIFFYQLVIHRNTSMETQLVIQFDKLMRTGNIGFVCFSWKCEPLPALTGLHSPVACQKKKQANVLKWRVARLPWEKLTNPPGPGAEWGSADYDWSILAPLNPYVPCSTAVSKLVNAFRDLLTVKIPHHTVSGWRYNRFLCFFTCRIIIVWLCLIKLQYFS